MNLLDTGPVVCAHLQKVTHSHAKPNAPTVAQQDVKNNLIPPTLRKVRQEVHEKQLREQKRMPESKREREIV